MNAFMTDCPRSACSSHLPDGIVGGADGCEGGLAPVLPQYRPDEPECEHEPTLQYISISSVIRTSIALLDPPEDDEDYPEQPLHPVPPVLRDVPHPVARRGIAVLLYLRSGVNNLGGTKNFNAGKIFLVDDKYFSIDNM